MKQSKQVADSMLLGHPRGLFILFLTEMWERFSYYGMRALLVLFLVDRVGGGFGWTEADALHLSGIYLMAAYVLGIVGGFVADKWIGQKSAVLWGGILACIGHFLLAAQNETLFMIGLFLIASGTGLLKPNISSLVGGLYAAGDKRRDGGFTIFYMGINLGGLLAGLVIGGIGQVYGWHYGFGLAGVGMLLGIGVFLWGQKYLASVKTNSEVGVSFKKAPTTDKRPFTKEEKDRLWALVVSFIAVFSFFVAFEQAAGLMSLYTDKYTDRHILGVEVPASMFQSVNPFFVILLGPVVALMWSWLAKRFKHISAFYKLGIGNILVGLGFLFMVGAAMQLHLPGLTKSSMHWLINAYLFHTIGELCLSPISLSFVTKLAPQRISASMMGVYFTMPGFANYVAAWIGRQSVSWGDLAVFQFLFWTTLAIGLLFLVFNKKLIRLAHGAE